MRPVWRPSRLHSVWPWRARMICSETGIHCHLACDRGYAARLRLRRGLARHARPAGGQGRQRGRDDPRAGSRARPGRVHHHHRGVRGLHGGRPHRARGPGGGGRRGPLAPGGARRQDAGRRRGPAAGVGALRRARVDARHARHGPEPGHERHVGAGTGSSHRVRALRLGLLPALRADVRQRVPRRQRRGHREGDQEAQVRRRRGAGHRPVGRRPQGPGGRLQGALPRRDRRGLPAGPARAADPGHPRRVRLLGRPARQGVPAHQPHPRRVGHRGERAADGVRQQGRHVVLGRGLLARRDHRGARAVGRLPGQRAGRGRGLRCAHAQGPVRDEGGRCPTPTPS